MREYLKTKELPKIYIQIAALFTMAIISISLCVGMFFYPRHVRALENQTIANTAISDGYIKAASEVLTSNGFSRNEI